MNENKHVEDYLDYYCDPQKKIPFAVLLKGQWGCGKTYFIKNYIKKRKNLLHVSLYGVKKFNEIKEKLIIELVPFIPEKYNKIMGVIIKSVGKISKIEKIKNILPSDTDELLMELFLKKNKKYVFVFDDLERCGIEIKDLFGYINNLVEFSGQKVILISNENEISESSKYREIKEKLIGKEFNINSSGKEAIELFISLLTDKELIKHSEKIEKLLLKIFTQSKYNNLRIIQQALSQFEYFFRSFQSKSKESVELFEKMFYEFIVIFIEYKKGKIKPDDFWGKYPSFFKDSDKDKKDQEHFLDKYDPGTSSWLTCFDAKILGKIIQGISLSEQELTMMVENLENIAEINKESWQKVWNRYEQSDEGFFKNLEEVIKKWETKEYKDFFVIVHVFGLLLDSSEDGFIEKSKELILDEGKEYINFLITEGNFPLDLKEQGGHFGWHDHAYGLQYYGTKNEEWKKMVCFVNEKIEEQEEPAFKLKIEKELMPILLGNKSLAGGLNLFMNYNFLQFDGNKKAYFQYFDVNKIVSILLNGEGFIVRSLKEVFEKRYRDVKNEIEGIEKEIPFLNKLKIKLENEIINAEEKFNGKKTPRSLLLREFVYNVLEPAINNLKNMKKVIIIHGCPSNAEKAMNPETRTYDKHWIPWIRERLVEKGIKVETPLMPDPWQPNYEKFKVEFEKFEVDESTILIGHSCGCAFLVRWLGESKQKIAKLILVAPWKISQEERDGADIEFYGYKIDESIKDRVKKIVMFTADDEEEDGKRSLKIYNESLGGEIIELKGHGHYTMGDMGTTDFPELLDIICN